MNMNSARRVFRAISVAVATAGLVPMNSKSETLDARGAQFIPFKSFSRFTKSPGANPGEVVLTSPEIHSRIQWNELIASWNVEMPTNTYLKVEARAIYPDHATRFYTMGLWSADPAQHPRESVPNQKDTDADAFTDTLALNQPAERFQLRITLGGSARKKPKLKFLGVSLLNSKASPAPPSTNRAAWGKTIPVPERSQIAYENGKALCSPTTVSMLLAYWSEKLKRPDLARGVPEISEGVFDPNWPGTGNWAFNMAYAGSFRGMRAYVTRMSDVFELEDWIARGIPVGLSVCHNRLRGKSREPSGHVVVCCGFAENGDAIINDPGTSQNVRKIFPRANLIDAWSYSKNTVYLVYPTNAKLPKDKLGHWDSRKVISRGCALANIGDWCATGFHGTDAGTFFRSGN
jgi:Peptidase_C39 like family